MNRKIIASTLFISLCAFSSIATYGSDDRDREPNWNQIAGNICDKKFHSRNGSDNTARCVISFTLREKSGRWSKLEEQLVSVGVALPDTDRVPAVYMLSGGASDERKVQKVFKGLEEKILKIYDLKPLISMCDICSWACRLPQVASYKEEMSGAYVFAKTFKLNTHSFRGNATSVAAYDEKTLNLLWQSDFTDTGMESLSVFINCPSDFSSEKIQDGFHLVEKPQDLWKLAMKLADRFPQIRNALSMPKAKIFETEPVDDKGFGKH